MAGLYIHIPFCKSVCKYCDFYKISNLNYKDLFISALIKEIEISSFFFDQYPIETIYFGGGTPSLLSVSDLEIIFLNIQKYIDLSRVKEITLEINPDDFTNEYARSLLNVPVNRLSFGIQSIYDDILKFLGRRHNSQQIFDSLLLSEKLGFNNVTIDLIYGIPKLSNDMWKSTLNTILKYPFKHLSSYHLIFEENTPLYNMLKKNNIDEIDEIDSSFQYQYMVNFLKENGIFQYEISNFSKPNFQSIHNSFYWKGVEYLGLGPSSHSYFDNTRRWNVSNFNEYSSLIFSVKKYWNSEYLSEKDIYNELIMLGLRTVEGICIDKIEKLNTKYLDYFNKIAKPFIDEKVLVISANRCFIKSEYLFLSDGIIEKFFII